MKRQKFKQLLQEAAIEQKQMKERQKQEEKYLEEQFRIKMLERMA